VLDGTEQIQEAFWYSESRLFLSLRSPVRDPSAMFQFICRLAHQTVSNSWRKSLFVRRLRNSIVNCVRTLDFTVLWG
jgi:hypothetical protein